MKIGDLVHTPRTHGWPTDPLKIPAIYGAAFHFGWEDRTGIIVKLEGDLALVLIQETGELHTFAPSTLEIINESR